MPTFENGIFPSDEKKIEESYFAVCVFQKGLTTISAEYRYHFYSCYFQEGSIICFATPGRYARFFNCTFEQGVVFKMATGLCEGVSFIECFFPETGCVIEDKLTTYMNVERLRPCDIIPIQRDPLYLNLEDGTAKGIDWEIRALFDVPRRMDVTYHNYGKLKDARSLDSLTKMMWRYPKFIVSRLNWEGPIDDQWDDYQKVRNHPNRIVAIALLTLLKVLPVDLVRGVLVDFLI